tara:strand:+ start:374 stop:592 length:219 start_codon:yes stop_codon:yes gene_type:complete
MKTEIKMGTMVHPSGQIKKAIIYRFENKQEMLNFWETMTEKATMNFDYLTITQEEYVKFDVEKYRLGLEEEE